MVPIGKIMGGANEAVSHLSRTAIVENSLHTVRTVAEGIKERGVMRYGIKAVAFLKDRIEGVIPIATIAGAVA